MITCAFEKEYTAKLRNVLAHGAAFALTRFLHKDLYTK